jgi:hypothetical protein
MGEEVRRDRPEPRLAVPDDPESMQEVIGAIAKSCSLIL